MFDIGIIRLHFLPLNMAKCGTGGPKLLNLKIFIEIQE